ncbi:MAG: hypothetical protein HQL40_17705 [Alphaproteobacteria bacterium]|nr:hypothetical protein [Alphaproteobacteria bacterium]
MSRPGADLTSSLALSVRLVWRRKMALLGLVALALTMAFLYLRQVTPLYTATATVMIETRRTQVAPIAEVLGGLSSNQFVVEGEVEVIRSRALAEQVIDRLHLLQHPHFNPDLAPPRGPGLFAMLNPLNWLPADWRSAMSEAASNARRDSELPMPVEPEIKEDPLKARAARILMASLVTQNSRMSPVVDINVTAPSPQLSAAIANAIADQYLLTQLEAKYNAVQRATRWLNDRITELRREVESTETAVETYRRKHNLFDLDRGPVITQQLGELNSQLLSAQAKRSEAEVRYERARQQVKSSKGGAALVEVLNSPVIHSLRATEAEIRREFSDLSTRYGAQHPKIITLQASLREIEEKIRGEADRIISSLANEVEIARAREQAIEKNYNELKGQISIQNEAQIELRALIREAEASRSLYEAFLARFKETDTQRDMQNADARVLSRAAIPREPSSPRGTLILIVAGLTAAMLGLVLIFALEELDHGFRSASQTEAALGIPVLGLVPEVKAKQSADVIAKNIFEIPTSSFAEAIRTVRSGLDLSDPSRPPRLVMVTSAQPNEGKSVMAYSIAAQGAQSLGRSVLLIDADLRKPSLHEIAAMDVGPGVGDYLNGEAPLEACIRPDPRCPNLRVMTGGRGLRNAADMFDDRRFHSLLDEAAGLYDQVVIDTPPLLAVSDARSLLGRVDRVLFVVRWARTKREIVGAAISVVERTRSAGASLVLSRVDIRKHASYGYGDSGQYYKAYRRYYTS